MKQIVWFAVVCMFASLARGEWVEVPAIRQSGISGVLGEIEDRMPANHQYRDSDVQTWAHEMQHGLNSRIRNAMGGTANVQGIYFPGGWACVLPEPRSFTLAEVAARTPTSGRTATYQLYLVQQQRDWNSEPLYLIDELSAYLVGAAVGLQLGRDVTSDLSHAREMHGYCVVLYQLARERGYSHLNELNEVIRVLGDWNNEMLPLWQQERGR